MDADFDAGSPSRFSPKCSWQSGHDRAFASSEALPVRMCPSVGKLSLGHEVLQMFSIHFETSLLRQCRVVFQASRSALARSGCHIPVVSFLS